MKRSSLRIASSDKQEVAYLSARRGSDQILRELAASDKKFILPGSTVESQHRDNNLLLNENPKQSK